MELFVNAEPVQVPAHCTIATLLARLGKDAGKLAVERNEAVIPRAEHSSTLLSAGDRIEIVTLVGGG